MRVYQATMANLISITELALLLWPDHTQAELADEFRKILAAGKTAVFLASESDCEIGFAQCSIRYDYVEGTDHSPVGYLEGLFVREAYRRQGIARELIRACEKWACTQGCTQLASDCELGNTDSLAFHLQAGFTEANRVICFVKDIVPSA